MTFPFREQLNIGSANKTLIQSNDALQSQCKPHFLEPCWGVQEFKIQKNVQNRNQCSSPVSYWSSHMLNSYWMAEYLLPLPIQFVSGHVLGAMR